MQGYIFEPCVVLRLSVAAAPVRLRSSAVRCGPLSGRIKVKADVVAHGAHARGACRRGPLPQCRRPGVIRVLAVWRRLRLSKFSLWLLAPAAERAAAQRRAVKRHGRWKGADRRRISSSPIAGAQAEFCAAARRRRDGHCGLNTESRRSECRRRRVRRALRRGSSFACAAVGACRSPAPLVPPLVT